MAKQTTARVGGWAQSLTKHEKNEERMEDGEQSLEVSLKDFERGMTLVRQCRDSLASAEAKVQKLIEKNGKLESVSLDSDKT